MLTTFEVAIINISYDSVAKMAFRENPSYWCFTIFFSTYAMLGGRCRLKSPPTLKKQYE